MIHGNDGHKFYLACKYKTVSVVLLRTGSDNWAIWDQVPRSFIGSNRLPNWTMLLRLLFNTVCGLFNETSSTFLLLLHHRALSPPGDKRQNKVWDPASLRSAGSGWCPISGSLHHTKQSHSYTISIQTIKIRSISKLSHIVSNNLTAAIAAPLVKQ